MLFNEATSKVATGDKAALLLLARGHKLPFKLIAQVLAEALSRWPAGRLVEPTALSTPDAGRSPSGGNLPKLACCVICHSKFTDSNAYSARACRSGRAPVLTMLQLAQS